MSQFTSGSQWYYIDNQGFIKDFIIHSGMSPKSAEVLAKVYTVYSDWNEAYKALEEYNKTFNTFELNTIKLYDDCTGELENIQIGHCIQHKETKKILVVNKIQYNGIIANEYWIGRYALGSNYTIVGKE